MLGMVTFMTVQTFIQLVSTVTITNSHFIQSPDNLSRVSVTTVPNLPPAEQLDPPETSVILLTSLIPTHPSITMVNETFNSIHEFIDDLPPNTPIYISVDGLPMDKNTPENIDTYHEYVKKLRLRFHKNPYVTILNNYKHGHVNHSIKVALELVETEFIYVLQHDLKFIKHVNHTALVNVMKDHPSEIQIVRFGSRKMFSWTQRQQCKDVWSYSFPQEEFEQYGGINLNLVVWSDNNHFTTKAYYDKVLAKMGPVPRFPEAPLMHSGSHSQNVSECAFLNQYIYNNDEGPFINHMNGRLTLPGSEIDPDKN